MTDTSPFASHWDILAGDWKKVAILGVGNELNGDDAAGVMVARTLKELLQEKSAASGRARSGALDVLILEGGAAPENFTGPIRRFQPDLVIFVDAANLSQPPGSVAWLDWTVAGGLSASTHTLPPSVLAQYLVRELRCRVVLVGIQPEHIDFDRPPSEPVCQAVNRTSRELAAWLAR